MNIKTKRWSNAPQRCHIFAREGGQEKNLQCNQICYFISWIYCKFRTPFRDLQWLSQRNPLSGSLFINGVHPHNKSLFESTSVGVGVCKSTEIHWILLWFQRSFNFFFIIFFFYKIKRIQQNVINCWQSVFFLFS